MRSMLARVFGRLLPLGLGCALGVASCAREEVDKNTQITVALAAETEIPKELDSFSVRVIATRTGELRFSQDYFPSSGREFPTTLAVIPVDDRSLEAPLRIEIEGRKDGVVFLRRAAIVSYFRGRNLLLAMPLRMACFQFKDCGPLGTCSGGTCASAELDAAKLPDFDKGIVFADQGGTCFDEAACLKESVEVKVREDCSFDVPEGVDAEQGNVSIRWAAAPQRILALDVADAQEGWTRVDARTGRLSTGACDSHFRRRGADGNFLVPDWAKTVYFARTCRSKTSRLPYCLSEQTRHHGIGAVFPE